MRRLMLMLPVAAAASVGAAAAPEEQAMLDAFDAALTAVAVAGSGLALFGLVWAGFLLMADGASERGGRARGAVFMTVAGLALALSAKGLAALLASGAIPIPIPRPKGPRHANSVPRLDPQERSRV